MQMQRVWRAPRTICRHGEANAHVSGLRGQQSTWLPLAVQEAPRHPPPSPHALPQLIDPFPCWSSGVHIPKVLLSFNIVIDIALLSKSYSRCCIM